MPSERRVPALVQGDDDDVPERVERGERQGDHDEHIEVVEEELTDRSLDARGAAYLADGPNQILVGHDPLLLEEPVAGDLLAQPVHAEHDGPVDDALEEPDRRGDGVPAAMPGEPRPTTPT